MCSRTQNIFVESEYGSIQMLTTLTTTKHERNTAIKELFSSAFPHLKDQDIGCSPQWEKNFTKAHMKKFFSEAWMHGQFSIQSSSHPTWSPRYGDEHGQWDSSLERVDTPCPHCGRVVPLVLGTYLSNADHGRHLGELGTSTRPGKPRRKHGAPGR